VSGCGNGIALTETTPSLPIAAQAEVDTDSGNNLPDVPVEESSAPITDATAGEVETLHTKAERGDADAQFALGMRYFEGDGVRQSDTEATKWIRRAAAQGHSSASNLLNAMTRGTTVVEVPVVVERSQPVTPFVSRPSAQPSVCGMCQGSGHTGTACRRCNGTGLTDNRMGSCTGCNGTKFLPCGACMGRGTR
jgi:hypothetical protein